VFVQITFQNTLELEFFSLDIWYGVIDPIVRFTTVSVLHQIFSGFVNGFPCTVISDLVQRVTYDW